MQNSNNMRLYTGKNYVIIYNKGDDSGRSDIEIRKENDVFAIVIGSTPENNKVCMTKEQLHTLGKELIELSNRS